MFDKLLKFFKVWLLIALILWNIYFFALGNVMPLYIDLLALSFYLGRYVLSRIDFSLLTEKLPKILLYFLAAYGMVLFEEVIAALINNINEGFSLDLFFIRVLQFWFFNVLGFSGVIIAMFLCSHFRLLEKREFIVLIALFGIYAEHVFAQGNPIVILVYAPVTIFTYYLIYSPAISLLEKREARKMNRLLRYLISAFIVFILSVPFVITISELRQNFPGLFPTCDMISCNL